MCDDLAAPAEGLGDAVQIAAIRGALGWQDAKHRIQRTLSLLAEAADTGGVEGRVPCDQLTARAVDAPPAREAGIRVTKSILQDASRAVRRVDAEQAGGGGRPRSVQRACEELGDAPAAVAARPRKEGAPLAVEIALGDVARFSADSVTAFPFRGKEMKSLREKGHRGVLDWSRRVRGHDMAKGPGLP